MRKHLMPLENSEGEVRINQALPLPGESGQGAPMQLQPARIRGPAITAAGALMGAFSGVLPDQIQWIGLTLGFVVGVVGIADIAVKAMLNADRRPHYPRTAGPPLTFPEALADGPHPSPAPARPSAPLSLLEYFDTDFAHCVRIGGVLEFTDGEEVKHYVAEKVFRDSAANVEFIGFHIPHSPIPINLANSTAQVFEERLAFWRKGVVIKDQGPGDTAPNDSATLRFSGKVYIYHEDMIPLQAAAALEREFQERKAILTLRGPAYAMARWQAETNRPAAAT